MFSLKWETASKFLSSSGFEDFGLGCCSIFSELDFFINSPGSIFGWGFTWSSTERLCLVAVDFKMLCLSVECF